MAKKRNCLETILRGEVQLVFTFGLSIPTDRQIVLKTEMIDEDGK